MIIDGHRCSIEPVDNRFCIVKIYKRATKFIILLTEQEVYNSFYNGGNIGSYDFKEIASMSESDIVEWIKHHYDSFKKQELKRQAIEFQINRISKF